MTLTDTGPLFSLVDKQQKQHFRCLSLLPTLSAPMLTTWPCFAESMYLVYGAGGWPMQRLLWRYVTSGRLGIYVPTDAKLMRMEALMEKYRDTPMDLADASLVVAAETLGQRRIFTLDSDFYVYRLADGSALEVVL